MLVVVGVIAAPFIGKLMVWGADKCPKCTLPNSSDAKICEHCGGDLDDDGKGSTLE